MADSAMKIDEITSELRLRFIKARTRLKIKSDEARAKIQTPTLGGCLPSGLLAAAKARLASPDFVEPETPGCSMDDEGRHFADLGVIREQIRKEMAEEAAEKQKEADKIALMTHGNDPDIRFDNCGFPRNRADRKFALTHDFGRRLPYGLKILNVRKWVFIHGNMGTGKTSFAVRLCWELMKSAPTLRPSYLCMNSWIISNMPDTDETRQPLSDLRRIVVVDDFDKFDFTTEFQTRHCLRLIQKLIDGDHQVIFTSNFSIAAIFAKKKRQWNFDLCLDRLRGRAIEIGFSGMSQRGNKK